MSLFTKYKVKGDVPLNFEQKHLKVTKKREKNAL